MTTFQNNVVINKPITEVYIFLSDLNNHQQLMPENITNWSSSEDEASFEIKGMAKLALKVDQRIENNVVVCVPSEKAPFQVKLTWKVDQVSTNQTQATFIIDAELNMMLKMVASGPLKKLVDHQVNKLKELLG